MSEELRELIYTIVDSPEQFFDNYYSLSFPKQWLSELNIALSRLKNTKKVKRTTTIPIDSLNATLKATASLIQTSKGITKDSNSSPLWLLTTGKEINIKSLRRILQTWAKYHFQQRWEYDDVQDLIKHQALEDLNWIPCPEATLFDWETNPETGTATPRDYNAFQVLADIIASKITETPLKIGVKERQFFKGPNIGEVVEWPPEPIPKNGKFVGWASVFIQVTVQQRYFNSHPFIQLHTGVRRFTNSKNFSPASGRKANLHFQTKPDYWSEGFPIKNSIQSVAINWFPPKKKGEKPYLYFAEPVAEILKLLGKNFINPNAKKIIEQIPEIIPEIPENITILLPYSTTLKNPSSIQIKNGLFFHDRYIIDLAITNKFTGKLKQTEILNPYQSEIKSEITKDNKNLAELIRRKYPNKTWMGLSSFSEDIKEGIKSALTELQLLDSENSPINFVEIEENLAKTLGAALDENGEDGRKNYIGENFPEQTQQNPGVIIIHTFGPDYAEYKNGKDPKKINRKSFCLLNIVSQFIVKDGAKAKYKNTILDAIRQLGITYPKKYQEITLPNGKKFEVPENLTFVGLRMLRITGKTAFDKKAKSLPVFVRIFNQTGEVEVNLLDINNKPSLSTGWISYSEAILKLGKDEIKPVLLKDKKAEVKQFIQKTLELFSEDTLLLVEQDNIRSVLRCLQLKNMRQDKISFDDALNNFVNIDKFPGLRIVVCRSIETETPDNFIIKIRNDEKINGRNRYRTFYELWQFDKFTWISSSDRGNQQPNNNASRLDTWFQEWGNIKENDTEKIDKNKGSEEENKSNKGKRKKLEEPNKVEPDFTKQTAHFGRGKELSVVAVPSEEKDFRGVWAAIAHDLRKGAIQYEYTLELPLPLDMAKKLDEYFRVLDGDEINNDYNSEELEEEE
ncbi:pPIWI_RE module domain-containing protein [Dapis sp. BLCC M126]|uniref:pPIWI_RE module domain-containing protein n=1 Tax=Dapis sp. BLCC M126 TaxID=3400189 RepID=UPI003CF96EF8